MEPYPVQPLRVRVDLGAMVMKGYSVFSKAPATLATDCLVSYQENWLVDVVLPLCREAVGVFYSRLGNNSPLIPQEIKIIRTLTEKNKLNVEKNNKCKQ